MKNNKNELIEDWAAPPIDFNSEGFAEWLKAGYEKSSFKTLTALAEAAKSNKATISRLMSGSPQTLTGKASRPKSGLVVALGELLNIDIDEGLILAGHAPSDGNFLVANGLFEGYYELDDEKRALARRQIAAIIRTLQEED